VALAWGLLEGSFTSETYKTSQTPSKILAYAIRHYYLILAVRANHRSESPQHSNAIDALHPELLYRYLPLVESIGLNLWCCFEIGWTYDIEQVKSRLAYD